MSKDVLILPIAISLWFAGVILFSGYVVAQILRFQWKLRHSAPDETQPLCELLSDCQREFGIRRTIKVLETDAVKSPALFGLFRLQLLLPKGFSNRFNENEVRYIFLHELAHIKRGDLWMNWLITVLQIAHWFNPLIWFGFSRLRSDRELACDELALLHAGEKTGTPYGETIIKLLEGLSRPAAIPGLVGILEDKKQMRRRIRMIANFKRPGRWSALALLLLGAIAAATLTDAQSGKSTAKTKQLTGVVVSGTNLSVTLPDEEDTSGPPRPDLTGEVRIKGGGPLAATVFISTAGPRKGTSVFCPSCYADCRKSTKADTEGQFTIKSLSPQLVFQILAVAKGYKPQFVSKVDPAKGPVTIELEPITAADAPPERSLRGRVVDTKGNPIEGAAVEMKGIQGKDGSGTWGAIKGVDPLAVTDEKGEFLITSKDPFDMMDVSVQARQFAPKNFTELPSGGVKNELKMTEGSVLSGRVLLNGNPLKGVAVGISGADRSAGTYLGHFEVGTGENGAFLFVNLPPDAEFYIYGIMSTMKQYGAIPMQKIRTAKDGEKLEAGDLSVEAAHQIRGRVELSDGQPVPPKTRLLVSREEAWDSMQLTLDKDGGFETTGLPDGETVSLSVGVKGYHISAENKSLDPLNFQMVGRVDRDINGLVYLLDKGPNPQRDYHMNIPESEWPQNRPLAGAEGGVDHSQDWKIQGRVLDSETREAITSFRVTPGESDNIGRPGWDSLRTVQGENSGSFVLYVNKRAAAVLLKAEADGYLPASLTLQPNDASNIDILLSKGTGPTGTVALPDGTPAAGVTVVLVGEGMNDVGLDSKGKLTAYRNEEIKTTTDANGHFTFKPQLDTKAVAAATTNGFTCVPVEALKTNAQITLQAYGRITGILKRPTGPGTNEDLDLRFTGNDGRGSPSLNLNCHAVTDSEGRFTFDSVPPAQLQLSFRIRMNEHSWSSEPLEELDVKAGQTIDLKVDAPDRHVAEERFSYSPPPAPKRIPGAEIKGVVLSPDGKPAAGVDVALQIKDVYLGIQNGAFTGSDLRGQGMLVLSKADGSFSLPMFEGASSVAAMNEDGYARVSLEDLKASGQITLEKWGRIEGTLQINGRAASNVRVFIDPAMMSAAVRRKTGTNETVISQKKEKDLLPPVYQNFETTADQEGHFAIGFIPPGDVTIARPVPMDDGAFLHRRLATASIRAGETTKLDLIDEGRTVSGKLGFNETNSLSLSESQAFFRSSGDLLLRLLSAKTAEERKALRESPEFAAAMRDSRQYPATIRPDGTFVAKEVPPGNYELYIQPDFRREMRRGQLPTNYVIYSSAKEIEVTKIPDKNSDAPFDVGTLQMKALNVSAPSD